MKLYLIVSKGKQKGLPIPIKVDLFLMGSDSICQLRSKLLGQSNRFPLVRPASKSKTESQLEAISWGGCIRDNTIRQRGRRFDEDGVV